MSSSRIPIYWRVGHSRDGQFSSTLIVCVFSALLQLRKVADGLRPRFPRAAALLEDPAEDILAYRHLPVEHQRQLHSTNPLERLNKEIKRRSNVVGIFPNPAT